MLRLTLGRAQPETLPDASARPLLRAADAPDQPALRARIETAAEQVRATFVRLIGEITA
jgi:hypothetical protein